MRREWNARCGWILVAGFCYQGKKVRRKILLILIFIKT